MSVPTLDKPATSTEPLTLASTCDACGYSDDTSPDGTVRQSAISTAYVRVTFPDGRELLFCGHHYAVNELALVTVPGLVIDDQRARLTETTQPGYST
jgi:hypothetical protein